MDELTETDVVRAIKERFRAPDSVVIFYGLGVVAVVSDTVVPDYEYMTRVGVEAQEILPDPELHGTFYVRAAEGHAPGAMERGRLDTPEFDAMRHAIITTGSWEFRHRLGQLEGALSSLKT